MVPRQPAAVKAEALSRTVGLFRLGALITLNPVSVNNRKRYPRTNQKNYAEKQHAS
jgi:hypothetical protein